MAYASPHSTTEFVSAAVMRVVHEYQLRGQYRSAEVQRRILLDTREIDLVAETARYFGATAYLAAQGTNDEDLIVDGPTLRAEFKYVRNQRVTKQQFMDDYAWLQGIGRQNQEHMKRAFIAFFPRTDLFQFSECISWQPAAGTFTDQEVVALRPVTDVSAALDSLAWRGAPRARVWRVDHGGGTRVTQRLVGDPANDLVWALLYVREDGGPDPVDATPSGAAAASP